jgi:hypothetical protein
VTQTIACRPHRHRHRLRDPGAARRTARHARDRDRLSPPALHITALTPALSGAPAADLREGSLFEPVHDDETFDLIVTNPPT